MSASTRQPNFALLLGARLAARGRSSCCAALGRDRADVARYRRRHAARADARLARRAGLVRPAPAARAAAGRLRLALVAADRCRPGRVWLFGLFADRAIAERLMRAVWPMLWLLPTMARHGRDRLAHRRPRGRADRAVARGRRAAGLPAVQAGPDRSSQCADRAGDAAGRRDGVVGPRALGRWRGRR